MKRFSWIISALFLVSLNAGIIWNALFNQPEAPKELAVNQVESVKSSSHKKLHEQARPAKKQQPQKDPLVFKTQEQLQKQGIYKSVPDGVYGAETRMAIARYQRVAGLKVDGKPSDYLLNHMFISANSLGKKISQEVPKRISADKSDGLVNPVKRVQVGLEELGYNPGPTDGLLGAQTREAIRQFEKDNKLDVTGKVTNSLLKKLQKVTGTSSLNNT